MSPSKFKLESIRFRTTVEAKADFQKACDSAGKRMSDVLNGFIKKYAEGDSNAPIDV